MAVTPGGSPYVESSDLVANYPATSLAVANKIDTKSNIASPTFTGTLTVTPNASANFSSSANVNIFIEQATATTNSPTIIQRKARGALGSQALVNSGDNLGVIFFQGHDGTTYQTSSVIIGAVDGAPGTNDMPGRLSFFTSLDGTVSPTERMRINNAGLITGTGQSLGAWTAYTPTLGGTGWAIGNGTSYGAFCQIGKTVFYKIRIDFSTTSTFGGSNLTISRPINAGSEWAVPTVGNGQAVDVSLSQQHTLTIMSGAANNVFVPFRDGNPGVGLTSTTPFTWATGDQIGFSGSYEIV